MPSSDAEDVASEDRPSDLLEPVTSSDDVCDERVIGLSAPVAPADAASPPPLMSVNCSPPPRLPQRGAGSPARAGRRGLMPRRAVCSFLPVSGRGHFQPRVGLPPHPEREMAVRMFMAFARERNIREFGHDTRLVSSVQFYGGRRGARGYGRFSRYSGREYRM